MPVEQITVAGNFFDMLNQITGVGNDLKFEPLGVGGSLGASSLFIENMSISGL